MQRSALLFMILCLARPDWALAQDDARRLFGPQTYAETEVIARELSAEQPGTRWERAVRGEAADFIEFLTDGLVLVGMIEVNNRGQPRHGRLYLVDAASSRIRWEFEREHRSGGSYSLLHNEPHLLLFGPNDQSAQFTALDAATGREVWKVEVDGPFDVAVVPTAGRLVVQFGSGNQWRVRALDLASGRTIWETRLASSQADGGRRPTVRVAGDTVLLMSGAVTELSLADGTVQRVIQTPITGAGWTAQLLDEGVLVRDAATMALVERRTGAVRWRATAPGEIQSVVRFGEHLIVNATSTSGTILSQIRMADGAESWVYRVRASMVSPIAQEGDLLVFTTDSVVIGLRQVDGVPVFSTALPADMPEGGPSFAPVMGMPDVVRTSPGRVFVARERAGVAAFALPGGTVDWYQPHYDANVAILNYTGEGRYAYVLDALFTAGRIRSIEDVVLPPSLSVSTGGGGYLLRSAQQHYETARERYASGRTDAGSVRMAAELQISAQELDNAMARVNSGVALANAIIDVGVAIKRAMQQQTAEGLIDRAQLAMQGALRGQNRLFQGSYYVRPFYLEGRGRGVTLVDTASGLRHDLIFAPHNPPSIAFGVDMPTFAVHPSSGQLVAVGINLKPETWEERNKWDTRVPNYSVLAYDVTTFEFVEQMSLNRAAGGAQVILAIVQRNLALLEQLLATGASVDARDAATGMAALHMATIFNYAELVQVLLDHGVDVNVRNAQGQTALDMAAALPEIRTMLESAGAEAGTGMPQAPAQVAPVDPNAPPPLATAALSGNVNAVRDLLAQGADPNWVSPDGETPLHYAVAVNRIDIVELLLAAGADRDVRSKAGRRPIDMAASDEMRELLRRDWM